ncbi:MAG TPA: hypothetical protein VFS40_09340 [Gemmatimonadales bacterium]|nr:hypothetical protein [Gemmatimonadales bacterium]
MTTPRRDFLGWLGASTVLAAAAGRPLLAQPAPLPPDAAPDPAGGGRPVSTEWDLSWVDRIGGTYRAVFDAPEIADGSPLFRAQHWRDQVKEIYGAQGKDVSAVLVIRHAAIPLAMNDEYWTRFKVGKATKTKDFEGKHYVTTNPIRTTPPGLPPKFADYNLERFLATGGIVLACNLAFRDVVGTFQQKAKLSREAAEQAAKAHLIPGIILQPSGIFGCLRAQQAGCGYVMAS